MEIEKIVIQSKKGDHESFKKLFEMYKNPLFYFVRKMTGSKDEAEDIVQETFVEAFIHIGTLKNPIKFKPWLFQIGYRKLIASFRKNKRAIQVEEEDYRDFDGQLVSEDIESSPEEALITEETRNVLKKLIEQLPELQKTAILMYYLEDLSIPEIASIQECPENTVKGRIHYARKTMKAKIEQSKKDGKSLFSFAPFPLLRVILEEDASGHTLPVEASKMIWNKISATAVQGYSLGTAAGMAAKVGLSIGAKVALALGGIVTASSLIVLAQFSKQGASASGPAMLIAQTQIDDTAAINLPEMTMQGTDILASSISSTDTPSINTPVRFTAPAVTSSGYAPLLGSPSLGSALIGVPPSDSPPNSDPIALPPLGPPPSDPAPATLLPTDSPLGDLPPPDPATAISPPTDPLPPLTTASLPPTDPPLFLASAPLPPTATPAPDPATAISPPTDPPLLALASLPPTATPAPDPATASLPPADPPLSSATADIPPIDPPPTGLPFTDPPALSQPDEAAVAAALKNMEDASTDFETLKIAIDRYEGRKAELEAVVNEYIGLIRTSVSSNLSVTVLSDGGAIWDNFVDETFGFYNAVADALLVMEHSSELTLDFLLDIGKDFFSTDLNGNNPRGVQILDLVSKPYVVSLTVDPVFGVVNNNYVDIMIQNGAGNCYFYFGHYNSPSYFNYYITAVYEAMVNLETMGSNLEGTHRGNILGVETGAFHESGMIYPLLPKSEDYVYEANRNIVSGQGEITDSAKLHDAFELLSNAKIQAELAYTGILNGTGD